ncbi:hypothetical protein CsSME_00035167 [Camellia sinensis var. sinensis]
MLPMVITQLKEQGLNTKLYCRCKEMGETYSIVPTSAISGEGIPDLLLLLVQWTQKTMIEKLIYSNEVQGPIVTSIQALLAPHPMNSLRVKLRVPIKLKEKFYTTARCYDVWCRMFFRLLDVHIHDVA